MSVNLAPGGILFTTLQVYEVDTLVQFELPIGAGSAAGQRPARIVHTNELAPGEVLQRVAARFTP